MANKKNQMTQTQFKQAIDELRKCKARIMFRKPEQVITNKKAEANKRLCRSDDKDA